MIPVKGPVNTQRSRNHKLKPNKLEKKEKTIEGEKKQRKEREVGRRRTRRRREKQRKGPQSKKV